MFLKLHLCSLKILGFIVLNEKEATAIQHQANKLSGTNQDIFWVPIWAPKDDSGPDSISFLYNGYSLNPFDFCLLFQYWQRSSTA